jgi:hypothetical protein
MGDGKTLVKIADEKSSVVGMDGEVLKIHVIITISGIARS